MNQPVRPVPRLVLVTLSLVAACVLSAGCGGGNRVSGAQAVAYARAVNLREGDVPGTRAVSSEGETTGGGAFAPKLARCGIDLPGWDAGSIRSVHLEPPFEVERAAPLPRFEAFYSAIKIAPTETAAARNLAASRGPRVRIPRF
jgi:hypothetical protein